MACQLIYNGDTLEKVLAPNGEESILYSKLQELVSDPMYSKYVGSRTALELYKQVYTPEFKLWGTDNTIMDANGEPKLHYHGTNANFNNFDPSKSITGGENFPDFTEGFFFSEDASYAAKFGGNVVPVFLKGSPQETDREIFYNVTLDMFYADQELNLIKGVDQHSDSRVAVVRYPHQIKSVFNQGLFRDTDNNIYYSMDAKDGTLDPIVEKKLNTFFRSNGFDVGVVDRIKTKTGDSAYASVDFTNMAVRVVDGKSSQLAEEAAHILVEMLDPNSQLMVDMMDKVKKFKTYEKVRAAYGKYPEYQNEDGSLNEAKLAKEAIGQVISQVINGDLTENMDRRRQAESFLKRIIRALRRFVLGKSEDLEREIKPFARARDMILSGYVGGPINSSELFYSVPTEQQAVLDALEATQKRILGTRDGKYVTAEDIIKYRVSNIVDKKRQRMFRFAKELDPKVRDFLADKGSIYHYYLENLMHELVNNGKYLSKDELITKGVSELNSHLNQQRSKKFFEITDEQYKELKLAVKDFTEFINSIDPAAKILTEQRIYDSERDIAGTIDVLVVHSDGRVSIFDYKNIRNLSFKGGITRQSNKLYEAQIGQYKRILKENYPIKGFYKSRIIPIDVKYENETTKSLRVGRLDAKEEFLRPIPVGGETFSTLEAEGESKIDRTLQRILRRRDVIGKRLDIERSDDLAIEYARLDKVAKSLQLYGDFMPILEDLMKTSSYILKNVDSFTIEDAKRMNDFNDHLSLYDWFIQDFGDEIIAQTSKMKDGDKIKAQVNRAVTNSMAAKAAVLEKMISLYNEDSGYDLTDGGRVKSVTGALFDGKDQYNNPLFKYYYGMVQRNRENIRRDRNRIIERIQGAHDKLVSKHGYNGFSYMITEDNQFIRPYNDQFWEDRDYYKDLYKNAVENLKSTSKRVQEEAKKDIKEAGEWAVKNLIFDEERFNRKYKAYEEKIKDPIKNLSREEIKKNLDWYKSLSPKEDLKAWFESGYVRVNPETMDQKYMTDKWKTAQNMPEVKEYLDAYIEIMNELNEATDGRLRTPYFMAQIEKDLVDKFMTGGIGFAEVLLRTVDTRQNDEVTGLQDNDGKPLKSIPLLFSDKLKKKLNTAEHNKLVKEIEATGLVKGTAEFELEYEKESIKRMYDKGKSMVSTDLTNSLILFTEAALTHKYNSETVDVALNLRHILTNAQQVMVPNRKGLLVRNENSQELVPTPASATGTVGQFDHFLDYDFYGIKTNSPDIEFDLFGNTVSATKVVKQLMNYQSIVALGLNPVASAANFMNAKFNIEFLKSEGLHFNKSQFKTSIKGYSEADESMVGIQGLFEIGSEGTTYEKALKNSGSRAKQIVSMRTMFSFYRWGDDHVKRAILGAMAQNYIIDVDGKVRSKSGARVKDASRPSLYELIEQDKDGNYHIPGLSEAEFARFRSLVFNVANQVTGAMTDDQHAQINSHIFGQMVMKFRTWMPGLIRQRFAGVRYDPLSEELEVGRFRVFAGELLGNGISSLSRNILKELGRMASFGLYKPDVDMELSKKLYEKAKKRNPDMDLDFHEFVKLRTRKLNSMAVELRTYTSLALMLQAAALADWDDDEASFFSRFAYDNLRRIHLEMSFFFEPRNSGIQLIKSPIPVAKTLIDLGRMADNLTAELAEAVGIFPENKQDKTPAGYYVLKQTPILNHVLDAMNVFNNTQKKYLLEYVFEKN